MRDAPDGPSSHGRLSVAGHRLVLTFCCLALFFNPISHPYITESPKDKSPQRGP